MSLGCGCWHSEEAIVYMSHRDMLIAENNFFLIAKLNAEVKITSFSMYSEFLCAFLWCMSMYFHPYTVMTRKFPILE